MSKGSSATSIKEVQQSINHLRSYLKTVEKAPKRIITSEAKNIQREAKMETPRDTGKLERNVHTSVSKAKKGVTINIAASARSKSGYNYAGIQHESKGFKHRKGKSHYLLDPFERGIKRIKNRMNAELKLRQGKKK